LESESNWRLPTLNSQAKGLESLKGTLFPAFKSLLLLPADLANDSVFVPIASLDKLYRVFERC